MNTQKPYNRPMEGWWLKNPFYIRYIIREATSIFVGIYALVLFTGLASLGCGEASYNGWLEAMTNPLAVLFHLIALAAAIYHAVTWFAVAPKVVSPLFIAGTRVPDIAIVVAQYVIAILLYLILFGMVWRV
jgi:fumarate reductase subunit C